MSSCIHQLFEAQARLAPDAIAVVQGELRLTYGELNRAANRVAQGLIARGVRPDTLVGLCLERHPRLLVGLLGILKAGGAYVPLEPGNPRERLRELARDARPLVMLTDEPGRDALGDLGELPVALVDELASAASAGSSSDPVVPGLSSANAAYVIYTSGSTGRPKGVVVEHAQVLRLFEATQPWFGFDERDVWCLFHSFAFDFSVWEIWGALRYGGRLVIVPRDVARSATSFHRLVCDEGVTVLNQTPSAFKGFIEAHLQSGAANALRVVIFGGEALDPPMLAPWYASQRGASPQLVNMYGITETTVHVTYRAMRPEDTASSSSLIGQPIPDLRVHVLDADRRPVAVGVAGEMYVGGAGVARGYLNRPELTAERFVSDPFSATPAARLYRTGDLARWLPDGSLEFLGRIDHQVKIRGYRIELGEIEARLREAPGVKDAVVIAREDVPGDKRLVGYVLVGEPRPDVNAIKQHLKEQLPDYMVPAALVELSAFPLTPNGKLDRKALPVPDWRQAASEYAAPASTVEETLSRIWGEVLGVDRVGTDDDFFELGGHSLVGMQIAARASIALGVEVSLAAIFLNKTISQLAREIEATRAQSQPSSPAALVAAPRSDWVPLSYPQEWVRFLEQMHPGINAYQAQASLHLTGRLDVGALTRSLDEIVRRHEIFRTTFPTVNGQSRQVVGEAQPASITHVDLSSVSPAERERVLKEQIDQALTIRFDVTKLPLVCWWLYKLGPEEHLLLHVEHHMVHDGWSFNVFLDELVRLYQAFVHGRPSPLPPLPTQFIDYCIWQRRWMESDEARQQIEYWRKQLAGADALLALPFDRPRPATQSFRGTSMRVEVPGELYKAVGATGREEGATVYMTMLAAFSALMHRYSGSQDMTIGSGLANRQRREAEQLIGMFVNTVAMRIRVTPGETFRSLLVRVREVALGAYQNHGVPFGKVVEALRPDRSLSHQPFYQVMFSMHDSAPPELDFEGLHGELRLPISNGSAKSDMEVIGVPHASGMSLNWIYCTDLFDRGTMERISSQYVRLLRQAVADPDRAIDTLELLSTEEREQLLVGWNDTARAWPHVPGAHQLFEEQARRTPDAIAVYCEGESLTYGELDRRANQLAHHLRGLGVAADVLVGLHVERSLDMVVGVLGVMKAGGAYLPLEPSYPDERLASMLTDSGAQVLLTQERLAARLPHAGKVLRLDADWAEIARNDARSPTVIVRPADLAYVIYTSGSTGQPKGVMVHHAGLTNYLCWANEAYDLAATVTSPVHSPLAFDLTVTSLLGPLTAGRSVRIVREERAGRGLVDALRQCQRALVKLTPAHLDLLVHELGAERLADHVSIFVVGGEQLLGSSLVELRARAPGIRIINEYGPTETVVGCCVHEVDESTALDGAVPIGRPIANTQLHVLDRTMRPAPIGAAGELYIGGAGVARGYLGRPELTAERFVESPFGPAGARLYRTGDLARYRADGRLEFLGRIDDQVKIRGFRIELGEIEALLAQHPSVQDAVVVAREEGPGDKRLVAYVTMTDPGKKGSLRPAVLSAHLAEKLPEYMLPQAFVVLGALPLTPNGKVDRSALPAPDWTLAAKQYVAPRTPVEETLAALWAEALKLDRVGMDDDFFELGAHSLMAMRVAFRISSSLGVELPIQALFETRTIAALAREVEAALRGTSKPPMPPLVPAPKVEWSPLSFAQERLWFLEQLEPGRSTYNIPQAHLLSGRLDVAALGASLHMLVARHESLRTRFRAVDGVPMQRVSDDERVAFETVTLDGGEAEARRRVELEAARPFNLEEGPLLRAGLYRLAPDRHVLWMTMHHIVSDGWSLQEMWRELDVLYRAFSSGHRPALDPRPIQYRDYAIWQRRWLTGAVLEEELAYWRKQLEGVRPLELPTDRPRPAAQSGRGGRVAFRCGAELLQRLEALSKKEGCTLFMTLLAAWDVLLHRYSGQQDLCVGVPIAGRNQAALEGVIGFFVNVLPLRSEVSGAKRVKDLLGEVRRRSLEAYAHQDLPFEKIVAELNPERDRSRSPLFQVVFHLWEGDKGTVGLGEVRREPMAVQLLAEKFDLSCLVTRADGGLAGSLPYAADLFDEATIARMAGQYVRLLEDIVARPEAAVGELELLSPEERHQLTVGWNDTERAHPLDRCLHDLFEERVARTPDATAVVWKDQSLTYRALDRRANQLAHHLRAQGVEAEVRVGVCVERSIEMIVALLGIMKAGGAYVPLDPAQPRERLELILSDAQAKVLVRGAGTPELSTPGCAVVALETAKDAIARAPEEPPPHRLDARNLAYVIYTSGSTGRPKGVLVQHRGVCNFLHDTRRRFLIDESSRILQCGSLSFDVSVKEIFSSLLFGGCLLLVDKASLLAELPRILREQRVTHLFTTPAQLEVIPREPFPDLRVMSVGGDSCSASVASFFGRDRLLVQAYGPTEATIAASAMRCQGEYRKPPPLGPAIDNAQIYVLDERLGIAPLGVVGEIGIAGEGLARGYLGRPELTADRFVPNPFGPPGSRLYRTGDLARRLPDGHLEFLGRTDQQVKVRGYRIELGEIEARLAEHPSVREAVVIARADAAGDKRLVAYLVRADGDSELDALTQHLRASLPEYMLPSAYVQLPSLPLLPSGKVDRKALPKPELSAQAPAAYAAPATPEQELLAALWCELFGIERVGIRDNFFDLGGHSLLAIQLVSRICTAFGVELPLAAFFEAPTIEQVAVRVLRAMQGGRDEAEARSPAAVPDLLDEIRLDPEIGVTDTLAPATGSAREVLLTGATGFIGAHLLDELVRKTTARVHCLVRGGSAEDARARLWARLRQYRIETDRLEARVVVVQGDLEQPRLGLSPQAFDALATQIDTIIHNAAKVNSLYPYALLRAANVGGTEEVLRLATTRRLKPVHHVSTLGVFSGQPGSEFTEDEPLRGANRATSGYNQSKWVAERMVELARERGVPVSIYRLGTITAHSRTGACNATDFYVRFITGCTQLGLLPDVDFIPEMTPVDYVCAALVELMRRTENTGQRFHLLSPDRFSSEQLQASLSALGYRVRKVPLEAWREALISAGPGGEPNPLTPFLSRFARGAAPVRSLRFSSANVTRGLAGSGISCPPISDELLARYLTQLNGARGDAAMAAPGPSRART